MIPPGAIDCDVHVTVPSVRDLLPYMEPYWREHVERRGLERENLDTSAYPPGAAINARPDWKLPKGPAGGSLQALQAHILDPLAPEFAICNVIHGAQMIFSEDLSLALCRAINNWLAAEWLDRDPRLRASIVVPPHSPDLAAEEVERLAGDRRFVQVLLLAMAASIFAAVSLAAAALRWASEPGLLGPFQRNADAAWRSASTVAR